AIGFSASVQAQRRMLPIMFEIARLYLWRLLPGGKRARFYSVNAMRARHPAWFKEDLERLFGLLAAGAIRPHVADRISFDEVPEAHRRLEAGGLEGKLVLCRISRCDVSTLPSKPALPGRLCFVPKADISSDRRSIPTERSLFPCPEFLPDPKCCEHE